MDKANIVPKNCLSFAFIEARIYEFLVKTVTGSGPGSGSDGGLEFDQTDWMTR